MPRRPRLLLLNGALAGNGGNTAAALAAARRRLVRHADVESLSLAEAFKDSPAGVTRDDSLPSAIVDALTRADGFLFGTGTHWDSWSSVLQHFLEAATPLEGTTTWLGKPAAVVVTEHSVGGKAVLSRLQGVLVTLGCSLPPMSGLVLSRAALLAAAQDPAAARDFWSRSDLGVVCHNLVTAARVRAQSWKAWPVDRADFRARWLA
ncbi:MAG TPA: NAD(P)H-dependent oxidoreductase [Opitutaceae bacterium]